MPTDALTVERGLNGVRELRDADLEPGLHLGQALGILVGRDEADGKTLERINDAHRVNATSDF